MTDDSASEINLVALAAAVVAAYVSHNNVPVRELPALIRCVHDQFRNLRRPIALAPEPLVPPVPIKRTVTPDHIISLEDGKAYKTLKRHLAGCGLTPEQYRQKWGLPHDYPMVAAAYAEQRSKLAKAHGLGQSWQRA